MGILEINNISKNFGGVKAVENFSMQAGKGQIIGIIGPNGAGKTTIFNMISGIYSAEQGSVILDGVDITKKQQHEIALMGIARTFQNIRLFRGLSCLENVMTAFDPVSKYNLLQGFLWSKRKTDEEKQNKALATKFLKRVGLEKYIDYNPQNLSYGLQRRLELARAIARDPKVLLLDEPAAGLNTKEVVDLIELILNLRDEYGFTIIIIEHRLELIMSICETVYVQNFGETISIGTPREIQNDEAVISAYLGGEYK